MRLPNIEERQKLFEEFNNSDMMNLDLEPVSLDQLIESFLRLFILIICQYSKLLFSIV